jgi:uncharacterized protein
MSAPELRLACDAMLGSLARWLRAAGYDSAWQPGIADWDLIRLTLKERRTLLTSDTGIFRVGIVRDGEVPALFVPHGLTTQEQLAFVLAKLHLPLREPRCMGCGGRLVAVARQAVREREPPRSFEGHAEFWECERCCRVFWKGTHWQGIAARLREAVSGQNWAGHESRSLG